MTHRRQGPRTPSRRRALARLAAAGTGMAVGASGPAAAADAARAPESAPRAPARRRGARLVERAGWLLDAEDR